MRTLMTAPQISDEDLAAKARLGCMRSFEELMRRFQVPLLHFLRCHGPTCDAEDVLQETFLRAHSRLHLYRTPWKFSTWLFTIARRASINYQRRARPAADDKSIRAAESRAAGPEQLAMEADSRQYLWSAAARVLAEDEQTALWLHYVEDMPIAEIAVVLDRSSTAVKTMMFRARKRLQPFVVELAPLGRIGEPAKPLEVTHG
jgi:RNA polymerase sigma-70 factor, ECF subfamily